MLRHISFGKLLVPMLLLFAGTYSTSFATTLNFSGQLGYIPTDLSSGRYSGVSLGQTFSGSFTYGLETEATTDPSIPGDYDFPSPPFGGSITDGSNLTTGSSTQSIQVTVSDDFPVDASVATFINSVLGTSLAGGEIIDISDIDTQQILSSGGEIVFGLSFISFDSPVGRNSAAYCAA